MRRFIALLLLGVCAMLAYAQSDSCGVCVPEYHPVVSVKANVRADFVQDYWGDALNKPTSGFKGKYLNLIVDGNISKNLYYFFRYRLPRHNIADKQSYFNATDLIFLTYSPSKHWELSAGKQVVGVGGYEYDRAPIDLYFCSEFWNNVACYQFGVSATYVLGDGRDRIMAQVCESPFSNHEKFLFAYNLMWRGNHDWFNSIYSFNAMELTPGKYIYYLALGNEFRFDNFCLQLDFMNRATDGHAFFFKDFSVMGELSYMINNKVNIAARATYDVNNSGVGDDFYVMDGTELARVGGTVEYYPLPKNNKDLRLFGYYSYAWGVNGNSNGVIQNNEHQWGVGVRWDINIFSLKNKK